MEMESERGREDLSTHKIITLPRTLLLQCTYNYIIIFETSRWNRARARGTIYPTTCTLHGTDSVICEIVLVHFRLIPTSFSRSIWALFSSSFPSFSLIHFRLWVIISPARLLYLFAFSCRVVIVVVEMLWAVLISWAVDFVSVCLAQLQFTLIPLKIVEWLIRSCWYGLLYAWHFVNVAVCVYFVFSSSVWYSILQLFFSHFSHPAWLFVSMSLAFIKPTTAKNRF